MRVKDPCPFCDVVRVHLAASPLAYAFEDEHPASGWHTLVVPRRHIATYFDCTGDEKREIWDLVERVHALITSACSPDGFNVGFNAGIAAGQTVLHAHLHVIPRYVGDVNDPRSGIRGVIPSKQRYQGPST